MKSRVMRLFMLLMALVMVASAVAACGTEPGPAATSPTTAGGEKIKVGLSFSDFATERWKNEEVLMRGLLEGLGYEVLSQEANHDVKLQNDQIDNMVSQGAK
ncbi:MAG: D-xylose transporter subunit XylF, partial [Anaerolineae bacterium]|nr:D-xylose transporter subunit XylF [Anaerolineae bacterium]